MRSLSALVAATSVLLTACAPQIPVVRGPSTDTSGVVGTVSRAPQCPVETPEDPCPPEPAAGARVTASRQQPGEAYGAGPVVAEATTDRQGRFRIVLEPGDYVVTAKAGMSCEFLDATVPEKGFVTVDVPCDTGIR